MDLDLNTLLYVCIAAVVLAAGVVSLFGTTQGTHPGFRWWVSAQWILAAGLVLQALFGAHAAVVPLVGMLVLQWPIVVLLGMRQLFMRKRPAVSPAVDVALLVLACGLVAAAWAADAGAARSVAAFALAAFGVHLYGAVLVTRLGGFQHSFALKALAAIEGVTAALEAVCLGIANLESTGPQGLAAVQLSAHVAIVVAALGLVPIALALTYERTVAKMRATHRKLRHLADIDVLTRLPNRRHFHELAARSLATTEPATAAVLMFDIENLKRINDLLGQATGDEALRQVGLALRETLRNRDVAGRLGGDEFAALLPDTTVADAVRVASRISDHLEDRQVAPRTARLTLNVGAVQMRAGDTIVEALRRADIALDDARNHARGRPVSAASLEDTVTLPRNAQLEPKAV
ncbi:MAG TPA: GGDEF domain-containing protein [Caldimonas sp.]